MARVPSLPGVDMAAYTVVDLDTGDVLAAKNAHTHLRPASTLKMLTAVTLLPRLDIKARYIASARDLNYEGTAVGLRSGYAYTVDQLFYGMLVPSANDAANALARANGGIRKTVAMMNAKAHQIGARDTVAFTPSGLEPDHGETQHTSAYDLAVIAREGMRNPNFRRYVQTRRYNFPSGSGGTFQLHTTNRLWGKCRGVIGVKTGYTSKALNTYVGAASRNGHRILVTGLRMNSPSGKIARLINWGFAARGKVKPVGHLPMTRSKPKPRAFSMSLRPMSLRVLG